MKPSAQMEVSMIDPITFATNRLASETIPMDIGVLLRHADALQAMTGIFFNIDPDWAPWLDTSYLSEDQKRDPDIAANVKAIADVCSLIAFVAELEDSQYLGFWRGPDRRPIVNSPLVVLDNEGQFRLCASGTFAEAILEQTYNEVQFEALKTWFGSIGIDVGFAALDDLEYPEEPNNPNDLHTRLYEKYLGTL